MLPRRHCILTEDVLPFAGRLCVKRERMHGTREFARQCRIYHAMALDPALPLEGLRHNIHSEMRLAARPVAGMALMQMQIRPAPRGFRA